MIQKYLLTVTGKLNIGLRLCVPFFVAAISGKQGQHGIEKNIRFANTTPTSPHNEAG
jgi:hypothetical protein